MKAAWYEKQGAAKHVLIVGEMDDPQPDEGEVRIRLVASGRCRPHRRSGFQRKQPVQYRVPGPGGSIANYATTDPGPEIPFWSLVFGNAASHFIGSDDVPPKAKIQATYDLNRALDKGWPGLLIVASFSSDDIRPRTNSQGTQRRLGA